MASAKDSLLLLIPSTVIETLLVIASHLSSERPATIFLYAFSINFVILAIWNVFIYPFFINPLRHLPTVHVRTPYHSNNSH